MIIVIHTISNKKLPPTLSRHIIYNNNKEVKALLLKTKVVLVVGFYYDKIHRISLLLGDDLLYIFYIIVGPSCNNYIHVFSCIIFIIIRTVY